MTAEHIIVYFIMFVLAIPATIATSLNVVTLIMDKLYKDMFQICASLSFISMAFGIWLIVFGLANKIN